jgi:glycosyltransferase involved in cell wall biosynthesis
MYVPDHPANHETFEILNIGSLQPYKGHPDLIAACAILKEHGVPFRCRIIGGGSQAALRKLIAECGLEAEVELLGPLDQQEVAARLSRADCYVQPSIITASGKMEGIPVSIMEALAAERPVVATQISGVPELVQPGKTGYLAPPGDPHALARALEAVYRNPQQARDLAAAGRKLVLEQFNLRVNVEQLGTLFRTYSEAQVQVSDEASWATSYS